MAERTTVTQLVQFGVETTKGTAVAANKSLPSLMVDIEPSGNVSEIRASGVKYPTIFAPGRDWSTAKLSGQPTYDELSYLLSSLLMAPTPAQQSATTAYLWAFAPSSTAEDTVKSFTVEQGSALRAHKFAYGMVTELTLKGDKDKVELSGAMIGQQFTDGITITASPTSIPQIPILAKEFDVWIDTTSGGLGTTQMTRVLSWELSLKNRFGPLFAVDSSKASFAAHVELPVTGQLKLRVEADSAGMAFLTNVRAGTTSFIRLKATSAQLAGTAIPYSMAWDMAAAMNDFPKSLGDTDGVYAADLTFGIKHDGTWGKALLCNLINTRTTL